MTNDQNSPHQPQDAAAAHHARLWCSDCRMPLRTQYFALNERPVCARCRIGYVARIARGEGPGALPRAILYGLGAAVAGAALLAIVVQVIGFGRILIALAIGWLVGMAINKATGDYLGRRYQILAVALTYFAVGLGSLAPVVIAIARTPEQVVVASSADAAALDDYSDPDAYTAGAETRREREKSAEEHIAEDLTGSSALRAVVSVLLLLLTLPLLSVFTFGIYGAAVGLLALGYGMYKAWELTGQGVAYTLAGPFRVGEGPIPPPL